MLRAHQKFFYLNDIFSLFLCLFFSISSFLNMGKLRLAWGSLVTFSMDRELFYGLFFIFLIFILLLFYRWANTSRRGVVQFLRLFYVQLLYGLFFKESIILSQLFFNGRSFDPLFIQADQFLFHYQPAKQFYQVLPNNPVITELFFFGYFFYFILVIGSFWLIYLKGKKREAAHALLITTTSFYILYIFYTFFPVQGPKYFLPELNRIWYSNFDGLIITPLMQAIFKNMNLAGAAFPSSHVAISLIALLFNFKYNRSLAVLFLPFTLLLFFSTIYIYAHYFVDVVGGILAGMALYFLVPLLLRLAAPGLRRIDLHLGGILKSAPIEGE